MSSSKDSDKKEEKGCVTRVPLPFTDKIMQTIID